MKKNYFCCIIAVAFALTSNAQFKKGTLIVDASLGNITLGSKSNYTYKDQNGVITSSSDYTSNIFNLYPGAGIFITDKVVVGTDLSIYLSSSKSNSFNAAGKKNYDSKSSNTSLGLNPYVRYYFAKNKNKKAFYYGELMGGVYTYLSNKSDYSYYNVTTGVKTSTFTYNYPKKYFSTSANIKVGLNYFVTSNIALNADLGYKTNSSKETSNYVNTNLVTSVTTTSNNSTYEYKNSAITWNFGFTMFILKKVKK
jgi:hypothetical protein